MNYNPLVDLLFLSLGNSLLSPRFSEKNSERSILKTSEENIINHSETSGKRQSPLNGKSFPEEEPH